MDEQKAKQVKQAGSRVQSRLGVDTDTRAPSTLNMFDSSTVAGGMPDEDDDPQRLYKFVVAPGRSLPCQLVYLPGTVASCVSV
jgi:hypothetical protein